MRVVADDAPLDVLDALDLPGPTAVVDHRRPTALDVAAALSPSTLPTGTWLVATTSGSTGAPRAVCRTRGSWQASVEAFATLTGTGDGTRVLVPGPLSSTLFLYAAWHARQVGAEPMLVPSAAVGSMRAPWDVVHLVPHQLAALLDAAPDDAGLRGRTAVVAGAALADGLRARALRFGLRVVEYYGAAELSFVAAGDDGVLRLFPGVQAESRDGVIWARSPYVALGYAAGAGPTVGPWRRDARGWMTVGDRGTVLPGGRVVVRGRGGAAVQTGGATVHVADVESALLSCQQVRDVVVVALPHPRLGQVVSALVESPDATPESLRGWARTHLDMASRPRHWAVVPRLPRTGSGKPDRDVAEQMLQQTWHRR